MDWLARVTLRFRFVSWLIVIGTAAILGWLTSPISFDQSIEGFFRSDDRAIIEYRRARGAFGSDEIVFVVYDDQELWTPAGMDRLQELAGRLAGDAAVERVTSLDAMPLPWKVHRAAEAVAAKRLAPGRLLGGLATVGSEVRGLVDWPDDLARLRERVCSTPLFRNVLVDATGRTTALVVQLKDSTHASTGDAVQRLRDQASYFHVHEGTGRIGVVGPPVLLAAGFESLERDNRTLGVVAMILMALAMLVGARSPWWAVLPLVSGCTTWLVIRAVLSGLDLRLTLSSGPIIAQTVVLCMPAASHLALHFRSRARGAANLDEAAFDTLRRVAAPVAWCSLTAAAGYLALAASSVRPVLQFGLTMSACNLLAGLLTFVLAAGVMRPPRWLPLALRATSPERDATAGVHRLTVWAIEHPRRALLLVAVPCVALSVGVARVRFESNYIEAFKRGSRVAQDYRFAESRLGGIGLVELVFPAPARITSDWLDRLRAATDRLTAVDRDVVTEVLSLADLLGGEPSTAAEPPTTPRSGLDKLLGRSRGAPPSRDEVLNVKLRELQEADYEHFLNSLWNREQNRTRILVRIRDSTPAERKDRAFADLVAEARAALELDEPPTLTGLSQLMNRVTAAVINTQFQSAGISCIAILVMLTLALRSVRLAALALVPTLLAVGLVLGTMGWLGIRIDMSTALVASVAVGLSVDDTFHCLLRWRREIRSGLSTGEALRASYAGTGPGVVLSSAAVSLGFLALVFSEFVPTANFGWLVAVATLGGSLGNLVLLPACLARRPGS